LDLAKTVEDKLFIECCHKRKSVAD